MHPSHALLLLEQDEQRHNLIKNLLVKFLAQECVSWNHSVCGSRASSAFLAQRPVGFTALLTSHQHFSMALPNPFPKDFETPVSIFFQKYHPLNTRWHRWPPQGWMWAQVHRTGLDLFILLIYGSWKASPAASPPHPSLCFITDTNLSSCFIFQQPLGQNKLKSSPIILNSLIKAGNTLINKWINVKRRSCGTSDSLSVVPHLSYFAVQAAPKLCSSERWRMPHKTSCKPKSRSSVESQWAASLGWALSTTRVEPALPDPSHKTPLTGLAFSHHQSGPHY